MSEHRSSLLRLRRGVYVGTETCREPAGNKTSKDLVIWMLRRVCTTKRPRSYRMNPPTFVYDFCSNSVKL